MNCSEELMTDDPKKARWTDDLCKPKRSDWVRRTGQRVTPRPAKEVSLDEENLEMGRRRRQIEDLEEARRLKRETEEIWGGKR